MIAHLDWARDGADWPNRDASRFVDAAGMVWHVQIMGQGPVILLLHGTGASTHSWRDILPKLADRFTVVAPDLPGHGFTADPPASAQSLPGMASAVADLLRKLGLMPFRGVGHSAGAAVLVRMTVRKMIAPDDIVSFNGAFFPVSGVAGHFFTPLAKAAAATSFMPKLFASMADQKAVERLLKDTGSKIDARGLDLYRRLFANQGHVAGTLRHDGGLGPALDRTGSAQPHLPPLSRARRSRPYHLATRQRPGRKALPDGQRHHLGKPRTSGSRGEPRPRGGDHCRPGRLPLAQFEIDTV